MVAGAACHTSVGATIEDYRALRQRLVGGRNKEELQTTEGRRAAAERVAAARCGSATSRKLGCVHTLLNLIIVFN